MSIKEQKLSLYKEYMRSYYRGHLIIRGIPKEDIDTELSKIFESNPITEVPKRYTLNKLKRIVNGQSIFNIKRP